MAVYRLVIFQITPAGMVWCEGEPKMVTLHGIVGDPELKGLISGTESNSYIHQAEDIPRSCVKTLPNRPHHHRQQLPGGKRSQPTLCVFP